MVLLSTAYWPNLHYFYYILNSDEIFIEQHEHYQKQSFRNRAQVLTANGPISLNIPVVNKGNKQVIKDIEISYAENWPINHWRTIESAYKNSPYFDFFETEIKQFYEGKHESLLQYNTAQLKLLLKMLRIKKTINFTAEFRKVIPEGIDLRNSIHPKIEMETDKRVFEKLTVPYYQTFQEKFPFTPNLSMLDLVFNKGLKAVEYLKK